ncbi:MAG: hypothetical protein KDA89_09100, partial [Planctomycetaceae bacterium]|nr:hypothetical protein [Planctomycetaceae bacterium]
MLRNGAASVRQMLLWTVACSTFLSLPVASVADGERDNNALEVRRIPKEGVAVPAARETSLREQLQQLQNKLQHLQMLKQASASGLLPDIMIFERAVRVALDHNEFFDEKELDKADALLAEGLHRADELLAGKPAWHQQSGLVVRGYISRIDHTVQPYGLVIPNSYAFTNSVPTRCDLWFHGRGETLSEVNFIW